MRHRVEVIATGVRLDEYPGAEPGRGQARDLVFIRSTGFVEFDAGNGVERWDGTPQGPFAISPSESATSELLCLADDKPDNEMLGDLGIAGFKASRFEFHAAPRRIELDPRLSDRLILD